MNLLVTLWGHGRLPNIICSVSSFRVQVDKHLWVMTLYGSCILLFRYPKVKISVLIGWHTIGWDGCRHLAFPGFDYVCIYELMGDVTSGFPPNGSWISCGMKSVFSPINFLWFFVVYMLENIVIKIYIHFVRTSNIFLVVVVQVVSSL